MGGPDETRDGRDRLGDARMAECFSGGFGGGVFCDNTHDDAGGYDGVRATGFGLAAV